MRLRIRHDIVARYDEPVSLASRSLRLCPRTFDGQYVRAWHLDVTGDCRQARSADAFGNVVHDCAIEGPAGEIAIVAEGEVDVDDTAGVLQGAPLDRLPPDIFRRETPVTASTPTVLAFAGKARALSDGTPLDLCHRLMRLIHREVEALPADPDELCGVRAVAAADVLAAARGTPADLAHLHIAAARGLGLPARFVSGYLWQEEATATGALAAWAEALIPGLGWVGFDAVRDTSPTDAYVRVASALDQSGAAWVRAADRGAAAVSVTVTAAADRLS
ncbi:transglutaminase family protein [Pleomorphomonas koreensis]|uniref:transglutaminase family protein n=1 Tax=Pleomorphomonas koreensis TaxID=257440 RepID=UPI000427CA4C|nr:transglutaminase N-terminal domain-containing protein [Pleomorphomonas koreensis]